MRIVVDAMGGDFAPQAIVAGVVEAVNDFDIKVTLVGIQDQVRAELAKYQYPSNRIDVVHASEVVGMHEPAIVPLRKKKDSSITVGVELLKKFGYDAFVSAGNTAAVVAAATIKIGMLPGVDRPAIGLVIPALDGVSFLIDVGANADPKPNHLYQSALMAQIYAREVLGISNPRVGLINIGEEEGKGTDFQKETHKLMAEHLKNFVGNVEPNEIFNGQSDCLICDGFVGNVIIKVGEGVMEAMSTLVKREVKKSPLAMLGAVLMRKSLNNVKKHADYAEYGGAPLLGVDGLVMISHGRSSPRAIKNAIRATMREVEHKILDAMQRAVAA